MYSYAQNETENNEILVFTKRLLAALELGEIIPEALAILAEDPVIAPRIRNAIKSRKSVYEKVAKAWQESSDTNPANKPKTWATEFFEDESIFSYFYIQFVRRAGSISASTIQTFRSLLSIASFEADKISDLNYSE